MNKLKLTSAIVMAMAATAVFAHHPSADMSPNYEEVNDMLIEMDSPHIDMTFDDMGSTTATGDTAMDQAATTQEGWAYQTVQSGELTQEQPQGPAVDTMDLLEEID